LKLSYILGKLRAPSGITIRLAGYAFSFIPRLTEFSFQRALSMLDTDSEVIVFISAIEAESLNWININYSKINVAASKQFVPGVQFVHKVQASCRNRNGAQTSVISSDVKEKYLSLTQIKSKN